jgi:hypothetical protein
VTITSQYQGGSVVANQAMFSMPNQLRTLFVDQQPVLFKTAAAERATFGWRRRAAGPGRRPTVSDSPQICRRIPPSIRSYGISHFNESPEVMQRLASGDLPALCHVVTCDEEGLACSA